MENILTAEDFVYTNLYTYYIDGKANAEDRVLEGVPINELIELFTEFAKLHIKQALKEASEKAKTKSKSSSSTKAAYSRIISKEIIDKKSILSAYPLDNIKLYGK